MVGEGREECVEGVGGEEVERWIMPGALGYVSGGRDVEGPSERAFFTRAIGGVDGEAGAVWALGNHLTPRLVRAHNLDRIIPRELFEERPELFPVIDGERWEPPARSRSNWNPDLGSEEVVAFVAEAAKRFFAENPDVEAFSVGTNDGLVYGESEATLQWVYPPRWFRQRPDYSDLVFQFTNGVAERLEEAFPEKYIGQLAYYWSENTLGFGLHPRVVPILTADRSQFYDPAFRAEELALQEAWGRLGAERMSIYDYSYGRSFLIPRIYVRHFAEHIQNARRAGFTDYFTEMTPNWGLDGPQPWVIARLLLDPEQDVEVLLQEYYCRFFGPAAAPMERFFNLAEHLWRTQEGPAYWLKHFRNESQAVVIPLGARRALWDYLEEALFKAADHFPYEERVAFVEKAFGVSSRFLEMVERRRDLAEALFAEVPPDDSLRVLLDVYRNTRKDFEADIHHLWETEPLAVRPTELSPYLLHDPGPTAEALLDGRLAPADVIGLEHLVPRGWEEGDRVGQRVAGLPYRLDLAEPWRSQVEPFEGLLAEGRRAADGGTFLRLENHKLTSFWQWRPVPAGQVGRAQVSMRGRLSPGAYALLSVRWGTAAGSLVEPAVDIRLPEGAHWRAVPLRQFLEPPTDAEFVLVRILVAHQQAGDWLEVGEPSIVWWEESPRQVSEW